jgi:hypothetical protein
MADDVHAALINDSRHMLDGSAEMCSKSANICVRKYSTAVNIHTMLQGRTNFNEHWSNTIAPLPQQTHDFCPLS